MVGGGENEFSPLFPFFLERKIPLKSRVFLKKKSIAKFLRLCRRGFLIQLGDWIKALRNDYGFTNKFLKIEFLMLESDQKLEYPILVRAF